MEEDFVGQRINRLQNVLTMILPYRDNLNTLRMWLQPIEAVAVRCFHIDLTPHIYNDLDPSRWIQQVCRVLSDLKMSPRSG